jgi:hypothetical protein
MTSRLSGRSNPRLDQIGVPRSIQLALKLGKAPQV